MRLPDPVFSPAQSKKERLYQSVVNEIEGQSLQEGVRLPSTGELARRWKVAHATAHAALHDLMRDGWLIRTPRGTFVAPRRKVPAVAAIPLPPREDIAGAGYGDEISEILQGLVDGAFQENWQLQIERLPSFPTPEEEEKVFRKLSKTPFAIFLGANYRKLSERLLDQKVRSLFLMNDPGVGDVIMYDREQAVRLAIRHFIDTGRRRIGYFGNVEETQPQGKYQSYLRLLKEHRLEVNEEWIGHCKSHDTVREQAQEFLARKSGYDALYVANYRFAVVLVEEARYLGIRIPEELSLIATGVEGTHQPHLALSYVRIPYLEYGRRAIRHLAAHRSRTAGDSSAREVIILSPALHLRESTLPLPDTSLAI